MFDIDKSINRMIGKKRFGGKNDLDGDGVPNWKDCQPRNTMRQDTRLYLSKKKDNNQSKTLYTYEPTQHQLDNNNKNIFIGNRLKNIDFNKQKNIGYLADVIDHEEQHYILDKEIGAVASQQLDKITKPTRIHGDKILLSTEKKIIGSKSYRKEHNDYQVAYDFLSNKRDWNSLTDNQKRLAIKINKKIYNK